jgi:hypothetical protein
VEVAAFVKVRRLATGARCRPARSGELYDESCFTQRGGAPYVGYPLEAGTPATPPRSPPRC